MSVVTRKLNKYSAFDALGFSQRCDVATFVAMILSNIIAVDS